MCSQTFVIWGIIGLLFGPPSFIWPYKIARWDEITDAIGRKPSGRVEPAVWNIVLTKIIGAVFSLVGLAFLVLCVLL